MNRKLSIAVLVATIALAACGGTDAPKFPGSSCTVELPANVLASRAEEAARSLGAGPCGLAAEPSLRAHLVRIEKSESGGMRAVLSVVSEEE